jgi:type IX secretion system substrate protein
MVQTIVAQNNVSREWLMNSETNKRLIECDMLTDHEGYSFIVGNKVLSGEADENSENSVENNSIFLARYDDKGENVWLSEVNSDEDCYISSICLDSANSFYVCGSFKGELEIDNQSLFISERRNGFILKMNEIGDLIWAKQIDGKFTDNKLLLKNDSKNNLILAGSFKGSLNIDTSYQSKYFADILLAKFNHEGEYVTSMVFHGKANDFVHDMVINKNDEILLTGSFEKELNISENIIHSLGKKDAFLIKLNAAFEIGFYKQFGGYYDDYGQNVSVDSLNNILIAGSFTDEMHLNKETSLKSNGTLDVFLIKFDTAAHLLWAKSFGGDGNEYQSSMSVNALNSIYLSGTFRGEIEEKDSRLSSTNFSNDIFLAKFTSNGDFRYLESIGDSVCNFGRKLVLHDTNYIYLSGNYSHFFNVKKQKSDSTAKEGYFISKLYDCDAAPQVFLPNDTSICGKDFIIIASKGFEKYSWDGFPGSYELQIDTTGYYAIEVSDEHNCISRDTIFVQINNFPVFDLGGPYNLTQGEAITLYAPSGMKSYSWSDNSTLSFLDVFTDQKAPGEYTYQLEVVDNNDCAETNEVVIGVKENDLLLFENDSDTLGQELDITIFPNPCREYFYLNTEDLKQGEDIQLSLYSSEGLLIINKKEKVKTAAYLKIRTDFLSPGQYHLLIDYNEKIITKGIMVID